MVFGFWVKIILNLNFTLLYKKWNGVENAAVFDLITPRSNCNFPYCQPYNSYNDSLENLVLNHLFIPKLIFFFILITYLVNIALIFQGEILSWSLMGVQGLSDQILRPRVEFQKQKQRRSVFSAVLVREKKTCICFCFSHDGSLPIIFTPELVYRVARNPWCELVLGNDLYWSSMKAASYHSRERKQSKVIF